MLLATKSILELGTLILSNGTQASQNDTPNDSPKTIAFGRFPTMMSMA